MLRVVTFLILLNETGVDAFPDLLRNFVDLLLASRKRAASHACTLERCSGSQWFVLLKTSLLLSMVLMMKTSLLFEIWD